VIKKDLSGGAGGGVINKNFIFARFSENPVIKCYTSFTN
jgi:hypothetical protein